MQPESTEKLSNVDKNDAMALLMELNKKPGAGDDAERHEEVQTTTAHYLNKLHAEQNSNQYSGPELTDDDVRLAKTHLKDLSRNFDPSAGQEGRSLTQQATYEQGRSKMRDFVQGL